MNTMLRQSMAVFAAAAVFLFAGAALAQPTANGPYYATPSWDQTFPTSTRYIILSNFNSDAVLDRETGIVWERSATAAGTGWAETMLICYDKSIGGRKGWRPATIEELMSISPASPGAPWGTVFSFIWSSSTVAGDTAKAWVGVAGDAEPHAKTDCCGTAVWCVRGGHGHDGQ